MAIFLYFSVSDRFTPKIPSPNYRNLFSRIPKPRIPFSRFVENSKVENSKVENSKSRLSSTETLNCNNAEFGILIEFSVHFWVSMFDKSNFDILAAIVASSL